MRIPSLAIGLLTLSVLSFAAPSPVADAAMNRDLSALKGLIAQKADVKAPQADGSTALHWAAHWDNLEAADLLLKAGADAKALTRLGASPLYLASENGSAMMIKRLLAGGADPNATILAKNETPLMFAARSGNVEAVKALLDGGAQIEAKEKLHATTALIWAAEQSHAEVVKLLLARGAKADAQSTIVIIPPPARRRAPAADEEDEAPPVPTGRGGLTGLVVAVREGSIETVKVLLDGGAPINQATADGSTPLLVATQNGHAAIAKLLIERGANVNLANTKGWTPLYLAVKARTMEQGTMPNPIFDVDGLFEVIQILVAKGANVNARIKSDTEVHNGIAATWLREAGATPLLRAAFCADFPVMKFLQEHGADPKINTNDGTTTLMALAGVGYAEGFMHDIGSPQESLKGMKMLIDAGIDVNAKNSDGVMALHGAAHKNFVEGIQLLVDNGADLSVRSHRISAFESKGSPGNTPLDWATGVQIGMQSSIYHPEAVETITRLMKEHNVPIEGLSQTKGGFAKKK